MRILHILDHSVPLHSGYAFRTFATLTHQRALGWETAHITSSKHPASSERIYSEEVDGFHFYRTPPSRGVVGRLPVLNQIAVIRALEQRLQEVINEERPDVLHAHSPALNGVAALRVGRRFGLPVVYELRALWEDAAVDHGSTREGSLRYRLSRALETYVLKRADAITTISEGLRTDVAARGIADSSITVISNAVDVERFTAEHRANPGLRAQLGLTGKTVLGFVGSFYGYEGLGLLLNAVPLMRRDAPNLCVLLVGGGFQEDALRRQAVELGIQDRVRFTGRVPHDKVHEYYDTIDILVYPRLSMRLTELVTPLKPLEAMAQERLVIASDVGGHRELVRDGETGILFRAGDERALAEAVLRLLRQPEQWASLRAHGRQFVERERNWRTVVARYRPIYERLVARGCPYRKPYTY